MRRLVLFTVLACGLAVPAAGLGFGGIGDDGTLSVRNGLGKVTLKPFTGSAIGRVARGWIRINDPVATDGDGVDFFGTCDERRVDLKTGAVTCSGFNIRFRAVGGRYVVALRGSGIYLSVVGRGGGVLDGRGDAPDVRHDGVYSLNDGAYRSLPDDETSFALTEPVGG